MKPRRPVGLLLVSAFVLGAGATGLVLLKGSPKPKTELPIVVQSIQSMGVLKTAALNSTDVVEVSSRVEAPGLLAMMPGMDGVMEAATGNRAVLGVGGRLEAGVDLTRARISRAEGERLLVQLPRAELSAPSLDGRLVHWRRGLLWTDGDLVLKGLEKAKSRIAASAEASGLRRKAEENAALLVSDLAGQAGYRVDVRFVGG